MTRSAASAFSAMRKTYSPRLVFNRTESAILDNTGYNNNLQKQTTSLNTHRFACSSNGVVDKQRASYGLYGGITILQGDANISFPRRSLSTPTTTSSVSSSSSNTNHIFSDKDDDDNDPEEEYISPFKEFFDTIKNGKTTLGTDATRPYEPLFPPPKYLQCGISEHVLRFRTTSYGRTQLPPYVTPGEYKVMLSISIHHLPFTKDVEWDVFFKIVGSRYLKEKRELRLSSNEFASRIENKRHLVHMLDRIVLGCVRLAKEAEEEKEKGGVEGAC